jgi:hypothetical protein
MHACLEDSVFSVRHDDTLRGAVRASKAAEDATEMGTIAEAIASLDEAIETENKPETTVPAGTLPSADEVDRKADDLVITAAHIMIERVKMNTGVETLDDINKDLILAKEYDAKRLFEANVAFCVIPSSEKKAVEAIDASAAGKVRGEAGKSYVGVFIDPGLFGEPVTSPHCRISPINQTAIKVLKIRLEKCVWLELGMGVRL